LYPNEYIQYLVHFHGDRDYFECHEILEEYWKEYSNQDKDSIWVGFILLAVSAYHHRRANHRGAIRTLEKAIKIFRLQEESLSKLGIDHLLLFPMLDKKLTEIENGDSYTSFQLPISDPSLLATCINKCADQGFQWGNISDLSNEGIVHRHKLRDRSSVIAERLEALKSKKGNDY
jgi:uncharacterized protein